MEKRVAFVTLGCKLNFSETSTFARQFEAAGYRRVSEGEAADLYVINTCSVTEHADKKCRQTIRKLHKCNPSALVVVTGCYAQLRPESIAGIEGVDAVIGAGKKGELFRIADTLMEKRESPLLYPCNIGQVESIFPAYSQGERTRSFLKVQDGCSYNCSYCTIPLARGRSRNLPIATLVAQAEEIASKGVKEIVITGVNTGDFGRSTDESFLELLKALDNVEGIARYRISSIEPNLLKDEILRFIASGSKIQPHFHIPLQSGCNSILAKMRRRYNCEMFEEKISMIRELVGDVFLGIDVIVGFPGEGEEEFACTYDFLRERIRPAALHVFPYSRRADTDAAAMKNQVREGIKSERVEALVQLSERLHDEYCNRFKGTEQQVLFESAVRGGKMAGYTGNYIRVERPYDERLIGEIATVLL